MANSVSNLDTISSSQGSKEITANALFDAASAATTYGRRASTTSALTWGYYGGNVTLAAGTMSQIANGTVALTASQTNYIVAAKSTGAVSVSTATTNWDDISNYWRLYSVVTGASSVTSYTDARQFGMFSGFVTNAITKDGLTTTTAVIPFAEGLSVPTGKSVTGAGTATVTGFKSGSFGSAGNGGSIVLNGSTSGTATLSVDATATKATLDKALAINGILDITNTGQITFPATQNPSTDTNVLDDYEEGAWTPSVGGTATYNNQSGRYVKIGGWVFFEATLDINVIGTGSASVVSGLPFSNISPGSQACFISYFGSLAAAVVFVSMYIPTGATTLQFTHTTAASNTTTIGGSLLGSNSSIIFSGCFRTT